MEIAEIEKKYVDDLTELEDAGSQCDYLMMLGMQRAQNADIRSEQFRIGGCKTAIWIKKENSNGILKFTGDSDSLLVRGILTILWEMYNGKDLQEIQNHVPGFLEYVSDEVIYPEIKHNGILKCYQRLATFR